MGRKGAGRSSMWAWSVAVTTLSDEATVGSAKVDGASGGKTRRGVLGGTQRTARCLILGSNRYLLYHFIIVQKVCKNEIAICRVAKFYPKVGSRRTTKI